MDGADYAAVSADPALWLLTCWQPDLPPDLVSLALQGRHGCPRCYGTTSPPLLPDRQLPVNTELPSATMALGAAVDTSFPLR